MTSTGDRPCYNQALEALQGAHKANFDHPDRDVLGMSSGPFSGVNVALGIVDNLERSNKTLGANVVKLSTVLKSAREEIVLAIAFLGRDAGTERIGATIDGLIDRLAKVDAAIIAVLPGAETAKP